MKHANAAPLSTDVDPAASQLRAARAAVGWSLAELSRVAGVSVAAIARIERGQGGSTSRQAIDRMRAAYLASGVRFLTDGGRSRGLIAPSIPPRGGADAPPSSYQRLMR